MDNKFIKSRPVFAFILLVIIAALFYYIYYIYNVGGSRGQGSKAVIALAYAHFQAGEKTTDPAKFLEAFTEYRKAGELVPRDAQMHYKIALAYARRSWDNVAEEEFKKAIKLNPGLSQAHYQLGLLFYKNDRLDDAQKQLEKAVKLENQAEFLGNLGVVYFERGLWDKAEQTFKKAIKKKPAYARVYINLGNLYFYEQKTVEAKDSFLKALQFEPGNKAAQKALAGIK